MSDRSSEPPVGCRIVMADDDPNAQECVARLLRSEDHVVEVFGGAEPVIERVARGGVDLVLLDVVMPGMNGLACCRLVKAMTADGFLPVVLLTATTDADSRVEGLRIGADDYVCKPFDDRELVARVGNMLRIKRLHDEVNAAKAKLEHLAVRDALTGLYNYRYLHTRLAEEFKRAERYRDELACMMVDIDEFKLFNDRFGHDVGDAVLRCVSGRLHSGVREIDVVARYGGDEFLLVMPSTSLAGAVVAADRVWRSIASQPVPVGGVEHRATVCVGVAIYPSPDIAGKDDLIKAADRALYQAKADGRDRVCVFERRDRIYGAPPRG